MSWGVTLSSCVAPSKAPASALVETGGRCYSAQICEWCNEPLQAGTADEFRPWCTYGCCRFCGELE